MATHHPSIGTQHVPHSQNATALTTNAPPGTFAPGTKVTVGSHRVTIERYLSEGGFAHVYVVRVPGRAETAVLKRVAVPDKENLANMRTEVETMKKLKGHRHIVTYMDSHASQLQGGGFEVFLLMEFCNGGGLIDFMNTRLKDRLTEPEILHIFSDIVEGVACMHYLKPPLLHRDLKVENVLISRQAGTTLYKLCDFGSTASPRPAASTSAEGRLIEEDVQRHTTLQYRSPEMIDVYKNRPIDEKSDIWALGVLLYKLCYYTTPFEAQGQMAILTASFRYPAQPIFSDRLKKLIAIMLLEDPRKRPNIHRVMTEVCSMRGKKVPIHDIYAARSASEVRSNQQLPSQDSHIQSPPMTGAFQAPPEPSAAAKLPDVTPMRRGRPGTVAGKASGHIEAPEPTDPFAALDSKSLANQDSKFQFSPPIKQKTLKDRVTNALADEAFAAPGSNIGQRGHGRNDDSAASQPLTILPRKEAETTIKPLPSVPAETYTSQRPAMVSTGTMTSRPSSPSPVQAKLTPVLGTTPVWRVSAASEGRSKLSILSRSLSKSPRLKSRDHSVAPAPRLELDATPDSSASTRPSLEGLRPAMSSIIPNIHRSRSANAHSRKPSKADRAEAEPQESKSIMRPFNHVRTKSQTLLSGSKFLVKHVDTPPPEEASMLSNMDYLRVKEEEESFAKGHNRRSSAVVKRMKHASLPGAGLPGPRGILSGRFGDTFRRFEAHESASRQSLAVETDEIDHLMNITGSAASDSFEREDSQVDEAEDLSPEMRRELERHRLAQEERRVAQAGEQYRQSLSERNGHPTVSSIKASAIQDRVKNLLEESGRQPPIKKTAEGYGRFTGTDKELPANPMPTTVPLLHGPRTSSLAPPARVNSNRQSGLNDITTMTGQTPLKSVAPPKPASKPAAMRMEKTEQLHRRKQQAYTDVGDDWEADFSKRFPSLSLDMVEAEIPTSKTNG